MCCDNLGSFLRLKQNEGDIRWESGFTLCKCLTALTAFNRRPSVE